MSVYSYYHDVKTRLFANGPDRKHVKESLLSKKTIQKRSRE